MSIICILLASCKSSSNTFSPHPNYPVFKEHYIQTNPGDLVAGIETYYHGIWKSIQLLQDEIDVESTIVEYGN